MKNLLPLIFLAAPAFADAPLDGLWTAAEINADMAETCPAAFAMMGEQMKASIGAQEVYDIDWNGTFDPNGAIGVDPGGQGIVWTPLDDGRWEGNLSGTAANYVTATMEMLDPARIVNRVFMDVEAMMATEGGAMPGVEGCTLTMTYKLLHASVL